MAEESAPESSDPPLPSLGIEPEEIAEKPNRRTRRRQAVQAGDPSEVSKDRNARLRQQLLKKQGDAPWERDPLTTGELLDDAYSRTAASFLRWLSNNPAVVVTAVSVLLLGALGYGGYAWRNSVRNERASTGLFHGLMADRGRVDPDARPVKPEEEEEGAVFASPSARIDTALIAYRGVAKDQPGTGAATLARLGEASVLFDQRSYDDALRVYTDVRTSPLAGADSDVKGRAIEGAGFCLESKGDLDASLRAFRDLESVTSFRELSLYHQARIYAAKGETEKAVAALRTANEKLQAASTAGKGIAPNTYLRGAIEDLHRRVDPASAPPKRPAGLDHSLSMEDIERLKEQFQRASSKARGSSSTNEPKPPTPLRPDALMRRWFRFGLGLCMRPAVMAGLLSTSSCGFAALSPETPPWIRRPNGSLVVTQRRPLTLPGLVVGEEYEHGRPELDPPRQRLFVGSADRGLYALRADDLSTLWRFQTIGFVQTEPLYDPAEDVVYFGSHDGAFYKVRAQDGHLLWRFSSNSEVSRRPVLDHGVLYIVNANDTLLALDARTGQARWSYHRTPALGMEIAGYAGAAVSDGRVYTAFSDGRVAAFDAVSGQERWYVDLAAEAEQITGEVPRYFDADTTPIATRIAAGSVILVAGYAAGVFALDVESGGRVWANPRATGVTELTLWEEPAHVDRAGTSVAARRYLLASSGTSGLWAMNVEDGRDLWHLALPEGGISAAVPIAGALLLSSTRYGLFLISPLSGAVIDGIGAESGFTMTPAAYGRRAFVMSNQGVLLSLAIDGPAARPRVP